jgi:hypothetical protein
VGLFEFDKPDQKYHRRRSVFVADLSNFRALLNLPGQRLEIYLHSYSRSLPIPDDIRVLQQAAARPHQRALKGKLSQPPLSPSSEHFFSTKATGVSASMLSSG